MSLLKSVATESVSQSQSSRAYGSIQIESLDDADSLRSKRVQVRARQPCHGTCTRLKTAFRFQDDVLEQQFVKEQYRTPCFMRTATVFGVIQILIAPSFFYDHSFVSFPGLFSTTLFKTTLIYVSLCMAGGFVLVLFSRLSRTHNWWTVVGISSTMLTFCGYYLFSFVYLLLIRGTIVTFDEQGQPEKFSTCNETMFRASEILFGHLQAIAYPKFSNQSDLHR